MVDFPRPVTNRICWMPFDTNSSTTYWTMGLRATGSISLRCDLVAGRVERAHPLKWAFLDTETTGLAGGTGTYAFLVGVGAIDAAGFRLRQFFMRDYGEEASLLWRLSEHLAQFDVLITYNGKAYDQPLLE